MVEPLRTRFLRFPRERNGAAAVEFAIILPVMLLFYLGMFEGSHALIVKRKIESAAETVGGIVARSTEMNATRLKNIQMISDAIVGDVGGNSPEITITTVETDAKGVGTVDWQRRGSAAGVSKGTPYTLPSDLSGLTSSYFVVAKVNYTYTPSFDFAGVFGTIKFERTFTFRPRKGDAITWQ